MTSSKSGVDDRKYDVNNACLAAGDVPVGLPRVRLIDRVPDASVIQNKLAVLARIDASKFVSNTTFRYHGRYWRIGQNTSIPVQKHTED